MSDNEKEKRDNINYFFNSPLPAEQWFKMILDSINNGILVIDSKTIVRYINSEYTRITGVTEEQILGRPLADIRPGARLPHVIAAGKSIMGAYRREGDIEYVVDMAPIIVNGIICGGVSIVKDITEVRKLSKELVIYEKKTHHLKNIVSHMYRARHTFADIIGTSPLMLETFKIAKRAAKGNLDILILGESGTGKEVFAQAVHNASDRAHGPFVPVNCAAIAPGLIESELFGYDEGAFTGAKKGGRIGLFEISSGGTIFLDEIAELNMEMQAKLLRVLQERTIRRLGETEEVALDIRVIAATNKDLYQMVKENKFRSDVYYRLNVLNITLPPLREREEDIELLAEKFFQDCFYRLGQTFIVERDVKEALEDYTWPGNIRELYNVIEYTANMCDEDAITPEHLPKWFPKPANNNVDENLSRETAKPLSLLVQEYECKIIAKMLQDYGTSVEAKKRIAQALDISVATLYKKIKDNKIGIKD